MLLMNIDFKYKMLFFCLQGVFERKQSEWYNGLPDQDTSKRDAIWLEKDVIVPLAGTNTAYVFQVSLNNLIHNCEKKLILT